VISFTTATGVEVNMAIAGKGKIIVAIDGEANVFIAKDAKQIGDALTQLANKVLDAEKDH
jgi:hypothetical protein